MSRQIIAISGPPGAGKSTVLQPLATALNATAVQYDDFEVITSWPPEKVVAWLDSGAPFEDVIAPGLYDRLVSISGPIVLETPFGRCCPQTGPLVTTAVWLECPADLALSRKLSALTAAGAGDSGFATMLEGWLAAYRGFTRRALQLQRDRVRPTADFEVRADDAAENVVSSILSALKAA